MEQIIRELKQQLAGEKLTPEQLKGLIRADYIYRSGDEHHLTARGREALAGVNPQGTRQRDGVRLMSVPTHSDQPFRLIPISGSD